MPQPGRLPATAQVDVQIDRSIAVAACTALAQPIISTGGRRARAAGAAFFSRVCLQSCRLQLVASADNCIACRSTYAVKRMNRVRINSPLQVCSLHQQWSNGEHACESEFFPDESVDNRSDIDGPSGSIERVVLVGTISDRSNSILEVNYCFFSPSIKIEKW